MLKKLLKYDLKWIYKLVNIYYCLSFFFAVLTFFLSKIENSVLFSVLASISNGCTIAMVANCIINSIIRAWVRFKNNLYKDEAYLTHTLPVSLNMIYLSKVLAAIVSIFTSAFVSAVCVVIAFWNNTAAIDYLKEMAESLSTSLNISFASMLICLFFELFLQLVFIMLVGYLGIILGHKLNRNKTLFSVIIAFALYLVFNMVSVCTVLIAGLLNDDIMNLIKTSAAIDVSTLKFLLLMAMLIYLVYNLFCYALGSKLLRKGVNVD